MEEPISIEVVSTVAEHKGVDPTDLPPLNGAVDGDALESLFASDRNERDARRYEIRFSYADQDVLVTADGVSVRPPGTLFDPDGS